jgi:hypothetical protein
MFRQANDIIKFFAKISRKKVGPEKRHTADRDCDKPQSINVLIRPWSGLVSESEMNQFAKAIKNIELLYKLLLT